jgi:CubicO group peptidase (beta-lactamase class C family)
LFADMTLERLVRHRARIPQHSTFDDAEMARLNGLPGTTTEQRAAYIAEVLVLEPLPPRYAYSNAGYAIAGYIGEIAADTSWEELVTTEVLEPLGLSSCGTGWPATADDPDQPRGHYGNRSARRVQGLDEYTLGAFMWPAGNLRCSVADLARYGQAHLAGLLGENGFVQAATIQELHRTDDVPYAAGWGVDPDSGQHRHNGSAGTFYSYLTIDPAAPLVVAFLANAGPPDAQFAAERAADALFERYGAR